MMLEIADAREALRVRNSDLSESIFSNAKLAKSRFDNVNLQGSSFANANLSGARVFDVNLTGATIEDANLTGMTIDGVLVSDLIRAYRSRPLAVLYARNLDVLQAFYQGVYLLELDNAQPDHADLASPLWRLTIVQIPEPIAATIHIADPPERRTQTPLKLVFDVENIDAARARALRLGGGVDPAECEWTYQGYRICDGHDPEGNVVQCRERQQTPEVTVNVIPMDQPA